MKKNFLLLMATLFFSLNLLAQKNNIVIFAQGGERFTLILNGLKQNLSPETNVKVVDLDQPGYKLTVIFENSALGRVDKSIGFPETGKEYVFQIVNKKGVYKITYVSEASIKTDFDKVPDQKVIYYNQAPKDTVITTTTTVTTTNGNASDKVVNTTNNTNTNVNTNTTTTTTANPTGININVNENGMNVNVTGVNMDVTGTGTTETTVTNSNANTTVNADNSARYIANGTMCQYASITKEAFIKLKYEIDQRTLVTKMNYTKETVKKNCMEAAQVAELVNLFGYATDQLELSKFCYMYTYDTKNYDVVVNALKQDYNKPKLLEFIGSSSGSANVTTTNTTTNNTNVNTTGVSTTTTTTAVEKKVATNTTAAPVNTTAGCTVPMTDSDFKTAKASITSKSFEDSKLTVAKQIMKNKCLSVSQVKEIMLLFSFESTRLDFAKIAYDYTTDKDNYYQLNDAFTFESSIDDLNKYLETKK